MQFKQHTLRDWLASVSECERKKMAASDVDKYVAKSVSKSTQKGYQKSWAEFR